MRRLSSLSFRALRCAGRQRGQVTDENAAALGAALAPATALHSLDVRLHRAGLQISARPSVRACAALVQLTVLTILHQASPEASVGAALLQPLQACTQLRAVSIKHGHEQVALGAVNMDPELQLTLAKWQRLTSLSLDLSDKSDLMMQTVAQASCTSLVHLDVRCAYPCVNEAASSLSRSQSLTQLQLCAPVFPNDVQDVWQAHIDSAAAALPALTQLEVLHVGLTIDGEGTMHALLRGACALPRLRSLAVVTRVASAAAIVAACVSRLCELRHLHLFFSEWDNTIDALITLMAPMTALQGLQLSCLPGDANPVSEVQVRKLAEQHPRLRSVRAASNIQPQQASELGVSVTLDTRFPYLSPFENVSFA
jgi:hypothetical protein